MEIQSLEDLDISKILKTARKNSKEFDFKPLAEEIMNKICISNGAYIYHPIEIEFYVYDKEKHADIHVYPREAEAGDIFFHLSGMDICFESSFEEKNGTISFGGILIRALEREDGKRFGGPLTCKDEVLNSANARCVTKMCEKELSYGISNTKQRKGINKYEKKKDDYWDVKYRFFRDDFIDFLMMEDETFDFDEGHKKPRKRKYKIED